MKIRKIKRKITLSNNIQALSSPLIDPKDVKDIELRKTVESIGPTRWWENNAKGGPGYSFEVRGADHSSFNIGMDSNHNIFMFFGRVPYKGDVKMYSDTSQLTNTAEVLKAMAQPSAEKIIKAFNNIKGLIEDNKPK